MKMGKISFILAAFVLGFFAEHVNGVSIQFYRYSNFTGLSYESNSTAKCNNLPAEKRNDFIHSIKTDTCLLVYFYPNCRGFSRKFDLGNSLGWGHPIKSFHICNEDVGGHQLNVDITKRYDTEWIHFEIPDVLEIYRNVCDYINVPKYVQNLTEWSINNYGNDLIGYYEPNSLENQWQSKFFLGGHGASAHPYNYVKTDSTTNIKYKIQSLGPDPKSKYFNISCDHERVAANSSILVQDQIESSSVVAKVTGVVNNVRNETNTTEQNYKLKSLFLLLNKHDLEITKELRELEIQTSIKFSNTEQENWNLSTKFLESEASLRKMEATNQRQRNELQNLTEEIKNYFNELFS